MIIFNYPLSLAKGAKGVKPYFEKLLGVLSKPSKPSIFKTTLTHHHTPAKINAPQHEVGFSKPRRHGDNTPQLKAVFLRLPFLRCPEISGHLFIMTVLFGQPLWLVAPCRDIANPFNTATRFLAKSSDGFTHFRHGITA